MGQIKASRASKVCIRGEPTRGCRLPREVMGNFPRSKTLVRAQWVTVLSFGFITVILRGVIRLVLTVAVIVLVARCSSLFCEAARSDRK